MIRGVELFFSLFNNLAIFIALVTVYGYLLRNFKESVRFRRQMFMGISFGLFAIGCMFAKIPVFEGVIVDQRNAIIALSGAFGGPVSAVVSAFLAGGFRIYLGGGGALAGVIGVSLAAVSGIVLNRFPESFSSGRNGVTSAFVATLAILPGFLFVQDFNTGWTLMKAMALPYGLANFAGIMLVGLLLNREKNELAFAVALEENQERLQKEIAQRKAVDEELRQSQERLDLALSGANEGIWDWYIPQDAVYFDNRYYTMAGYEPNEFPGTFGEFAKRVHTEDMEQVLSAIDHYLAGKQNIYRVEFRFLRKNGTYMWIQAKGKIVSRDNQGKPLRFVGLHADITERKKVEESLYLSQFIIDKAPIGIWRMGEKGEILDVNKQGCASLGYTREELCQMTIFDFDPDQNPERWACNVAELKEAGATVFESRHRHKNNEIIAIQVIQNLVKFEDQVFHIAFVLDITDRKKNEQELLAYRDHLEMLVEKRTTELMEAMQAANQATRAKSDFLATMSHEIRTPMNAIIGMTHLAIEECGSPKQHRFLKTIQQSAESLLGIINDILDFSKIEAGQFQLDPHPFLIQQLLNSIIAILTVPAQEKGLAFVLEMAPGLPVMVIGDNLRIHQILLNLVGNAIKFTSRGSVVLRVGPTPGQQQLTNKISLHFSVTDSGIGIAPNKLEAIFNTFEQADSSHSRQFGGTGLGLSISKKLATLMGGRLWVESELGTGSTFHLILDLEPCSEEHVIIPSVVTDEESLKKKRNLSLLVVDDNEVNRDVASMMLEKFHRVTTATDGLDALNQISSNSFDLVLMDVQMPEMDGLIATTIIREIEQGYPLSKDLPNSLHDNLIQRLLGGHLPIVAMTAHATTEDNERCLAAGMDEYLTKPIQPDHLTRFLHSFVSSCKRKPPV